MSDAAVTCAVCSTPMLPRPVGGTYCPGCGHIERPAPPADPAGGVTVSEAFLVVMESVARIRESTKGYRAQLLLDGYHPTVAEQLCVQLHGHLLDLLFADMRTGPPR